MYEDDWPELSQEFLNDLKEWLDRIRIEKIQIEIFHYSS